MRAVLIAFTLALAACATSSPGGADIDASGGGDDDDDQPAIDANNTTTPIDANNVNAPDADPGAPDANTTSSCPTSPCDLVEQCGACTPGTQACDVDFTDLMGTACRGITAQGDSNDTCPAITDCAAGYVCVGDGTNDSCKEYCDADADCGSPRGQCVIQLTDQSSNPIAGAVVCSSNCEPASASNPTCPTGWGCDLFTATFNTVDHDIADCRVNGTRTQGQTCGAAGACAAGLTCVNNGTDVCGKICKRPAGSECTGGTTCYGFNPAFTIATQEYGVCL
jgi:hypothetical protein